MESNRDRIEEGRFFRLELLARRNRRDAAVPRWERWASWLYDVSSDYGNSIARPLVLIAVVLVLMGGVYWGIGAALDGNAAIFVPDTPEAGDCIVPATGTPAPARSETPCANEGKVTQLEARTRVVENQIGELWLYYVWGKSGRTVSAHDLFGAMTFSWNNLFRPFQALSAEAVGPYEPSWASAVLYGYGPGWGLVIRMIATLQSLVSIILLFLFALAMRRRFQIS